MEGGNYSRMSPEFALTAALETVEALTGKVWPMQPKPDARPAFAWYIPTGDEEERDLAGPCGLQEWTGQLHLVTSRQQRLSLLCRQVQEALYSLQGTEAETPETGNGVEEGPQGRILIEEVRIEQASPDLYETEVGYYRRVYNVWIDYQTEEIFDDEEEP